MSSARIPGLDTLRIFALALITWQHAATALGAYAQTQWRGISPGQSGVAVFCAIAGYLACRARPASIGNWCYRRFLVIFPAYWLVTIAAFAMMLVIPQKEITLGLFVSQMLGLGYFSHGWDLVNVVSWFVSLIILCYGLTALFWRLGSNRIFWYAVAAVCMLLLATRVEVPLSRHVLAYAGGALIALTSPALKMNRGPWVALLFGFVAVGVYVDPQFFYGGAACLLLLLALADRVPANRLCETAGRYAYEYFLLHGIFISIFVSIAGRSWISIAAAIISACFGAIVLAYLANFLIDRLLPGQRARRVA